MLRAVCVELDSVLACAGNIAPLLTTLQSAAAFMACQPTALLPWRGRCSTLLAASTFCCLPTVSVAAASTVAHG